MNGYFYEPPALKRRKTCRSKFLQSDATPMTYSIRSNMQVTDCKSYECIKDHNSHPLVMNAWTLVLKDPIINFVLDGIYRDYIYYISEFNNIIETSLLTDNFLPNTSNIDNSQYGSSFLQDTKTDKKRKEIIATTNREVNNFFSDVYVQEICNWMTLTCLYFHSKCMLLEPFQKHILCHSFIFSAVTRASDHSKIFKHLFIKCFGLSQNKVLFERDFMDYKKQIACVLVSRRQGKTFCAVKVLAAGLICSNIRFAYFSNCHTLNDEIRKDVQETIRDMMFLKNELCNEYKSRFRHITIHCPKNSTEPITATDKNSGGLLSRLHFYSFRNGEVRIFISYT